MKKWMAALFGASTIAGGGLYGADTLQNPYDDKTTHYELPIVSDIPQGERIEIAKDKAEMTLKGWNNEYAIKITPQIPSATFGAIDRPFNVPAGRQFLSKKMEYRSGDVTTFIKPKAGTENEFDIDFTLHSKPDTNVFTYKIDGAEEFDFFYQGELTPDEIAEGATRPENIIGSYAVYHKTKANNCTNCNTANYATGKAFHIYRPKAINANAVETWAEIIYTDGVLSIIVPQTFLDHSKYPVVIDPTIGYTSIGASNSSQTADILYCSNTNTTIPSNSTITNIQAYGSYQSNPVSFIGAIYDTSSNLQTPQGSTVSVNSTSAQWWVSTVSLSVPAGSFMACQIIDASASANWIRYYDSGSAGINKFQTVTYPTFPNPATFSDSSQNRSLFATYTASGGAATDVKASTYIRDGQLYLRDAQTYIRN